MKIIKLSAKQKFILKHKKYANGEFCYSILNDIYNIDKSEWAFIYNNVSSILSDAIKEQNALQSKLNRKRDLLDKHLMEKKINHWYKEGAIVRPHEKAETIKDYVEETYVVSPRAFFCYCALGLTSIATTCAYALFNTTERLLVASLCGLGTFALCCLANKFVEVEEFEVSKHPIKKRAYMSKKLYNKIIEKQVIIDACKGIKKVIEHDFTKEV